MNLTNEQQLRIFELHCIRVNEACDRCGRVLAEVRFTRKDQAGEWCPRFCRDGNIAATRYASTRNETRLACRLKLPEDAEPGSRYCDSARKKAAQRARIPKAA